jgi:hypothetical protein
VDLHEIKKNVSTGLSAQALVSLFKNLLPDGFSVSRKKDGRVQLPSSDNLKSQTNGKCLDWYGASRCAFGSLENVIRLDEKTSFPRAALTALRKVWLVMLALPFLPRIR